LFIHLRALLPVVAVLLLALQMLYISQRFDAYTLVMEGAVDGWRALFGYLGKAAKIVVLFVVLLGVLLQKELRSLWRLIHSEADIKRALIYLLPQLLSFGVLLQSSSTIFDHASEADQIDAYEYWLWCFALVINLGSWALMCAPMRIWQNILARFWKAVVIAGLIAASVWFFTGLAGRLWGPLSTLTFILSSNLLALINPELVVVEQSEKILGLGSFIVSVAPACSGYEGIGLVTAFLTLYLYINHKEFRFPRAFILFPLGIAIIWLLNVVRIAVLVALGYYWSTDIAIGGFHSQAGWVAFIATSLGLLWFASRWGFVQADDGDVARRVPDGTVPTVNDGSAQAVAMLMPLVILLAMVLLTAAVSFEFIWLYPLRVIAALLALVWYWPEMRLIPYRPSPVALGAGLCVALIWILMLFNADPEADKVFSEALQAAPPLWSGLWLVFRFTGAVLTVPIVEELAFRGYLLCKLSHSQNYTRGPVLFSVIAIMVSSLAFGALHGAWVAGTVAGIIYALVRLRSQHIGDAILAHASTNFFVFLFAAYSHQWSMI